MRSPFHVPSLSVVMNLGINCLPIYNKSPLAPCRAPPLQPLRNLIFRLENKLAFIGKSIFALFNSHFSGELRGEWNYILRWEPSLRA